MLNSSGIPRINELISTNNYEEALCECNLSLKNNPKDAAAIHYLMGKAYKGLNDSDKSLKEYEMSTEINPTNDECYFAIAEVYLRHLTHQELIPSCLFCPEGIALKNIDKAIELNPTKALYYLFKGKILYHSEEYKTAIDALNKAIKYSPSNADNHYYKALCLIKLNRFYEALPIIEMAIQLNPFSCEFYNTLINFFMDKKDYDKTLSTVNNALSIFPNNPNYLLTKSNCYSELSMFKEAIVVIEKLISADSCNSLYYYKKATLLMRQGTNYQEAYQMIENSLMLDPTSCDSLKTKGLILIKLYRYSEAIEVFKELMKKLKEEVDYLDKASSDLTKDAVLDDLMNDLKIAKKTNLDKQIASINYYISISLHKVNNYAEAVRYCEHAIEIDPANEEYQKFKRKLADIIQVNSVKSNCSDLQDDLKEHLSELNLLIGLDSVKSEIRKIINYMQVQKMRAALDMPNPKITNHFVFTGNPGTGKTTVARILGKLLHSIGVLSKGHVVEVDRSSLVAGYVGQTAIKTKEKVQEAYGGILFIDEAYSLANNASHSDFGKESIDTLLKAMEDYRDDFVVIVAGYPKKMENFINSNEGLRSRFSKYINFTDYTPPGII